MAKADDYGDEPDGDSDRNITPLLLSAKERCLKSVVSKAAFRRHSLQTRTSRPGVTTVFMRNSIAAKFADYTATKAQKTPSRPNNAS